jgi:MFS family permease
VPVSQLFERDDVAGDALRASTEPSAEPSPAQPSGWAATTFAAMSIKAYRLLWLGGLFSFVSFQMQMIARSWLAYDLTGSNSALGLVMFGMGVPMLLLTPWGGVAADRLSKRSVILAAQWLLIISGLLVAFAVILDVIDITLLVLSSVAQGVAFAALGPSRMAFTSNLVGRRLLPNAIVLQQMSMNGTRIFGPSLAGVLVAVHWFGPGGVFFLGSGLTILASVMTMRLPPGRPRDDRPPARAISEFADGLRYVKRHPHLLLLLVVSLVVIMSAFPYVAFLPTLSDDVFGFGAAGYGLMSGATAVGAVGALIFIAARSGGPNAWMVQASAGTLFGVGLLLLSIAPTFSVAMVILVLIGGATAGFQSLNNSLVLMGSESAYHGRVQSLMMLSFSGFGLVALPLGVIADAIGLQNLFAWMGGITTAVMVTYFIVRPIVERRHPTPVFAD